MTPYIEPINTKRTKPIATFIPKSLSVSTKDGFRLLLIAVFAQSVFITAIVDSTKQTNVHIKNGAYANTRFTMPSAPNLPINAAE